MNDKGKLECCGTILDEEDVKVGQILESAIKSWMNMY